MKNTFVILGLLLSAYAGAQKGTWLLAGNIGYSSQETTAVSGTETSLQTIDLAPKFGYQFTSHWTTGLKTRVAFSKDNNSVNTLKSTSLAIGPFVRYSERLNDTFSVYGELEANYAHAKTITETDLTGEESTVNGNGFGMSLTPTISMNIHKGFGINFSFGSVSYTKMDNEEGGGNNAFQSRFGNTMTLGVSKHF